MRLATARSTGGTVSSGDRGRLVVQGSVPAGMAVLAVLALLPSAQAAVYNHAD
jgi:hypothetical protein